MEGGEVNASEILVESGGISGFGRVQGRIIVAESSTVSASGGNLELGDASLSDGFASAGLTEVGDSTLTLHAKSFAELGYLTTLDGGTLRAGNGVYVKGGDSISGWGQIDASVAAATGSIIYAIGAFRLGDSTALDGVDIEGRVFVDSHTVTLDSKGFASLGNMTVLDGGTLVAANGVVIGPGKSLSGSGSVNAQVSAAFGSTIDATGNLVLGDANAYDGFFSDGSLLTGAHTVTIKDRNEAVLGSLTQLGDGVDGGALTAGNASPSDTYAHFLLEQGKNMVGRGSVNRSSGPPSADFRR